MSHKKAPPVVNDEPTMTGPRARTEAGTLRRKRADTHVGTIEAQYHVDFEVRSYIHLGTLLEREDLPSLTQLLDKYKK